MLVSDSVIGVIIGNGRVTKDECSALGCCWLPLARHLIQVGCYMPQADLYKTNLDPHVSV